MAVLEVLKATLRTRGYLEEGEKEGKSLVDAMRDSALETYEHFDGELEKLVRSGVVSFANAMLHASNAGNLRVQMANLQTKEEVAGLVVTREY